MFDLCLCDAPAVNHEGWWHAVGTIVRGDDHDGFDVSLEWWGRLAYWQQWLGAAKRLVNGADRVMFLGSYNGPDAALHLGWPAWRNGNRVHLQNSFILAAQLSKQFNPNEADQYVGNRQTLSEGGDQISEWIVSVADVQAFVERRSALWFPL